MKVYHALFSGLEYRPFAYNLRGSITGYYHKLDVIKFLYRCRLTKKSCQKLCDRLNNKQK